MLPSNTTEPFWNGHRVRVNLVQSPQRMVTRDASGGGRAQNGISNHRPVHRNKYTVSSFKQRRFLLKKHSTTSVVITVIFVLIFTCIVAMEVLFIDENRRLRIWHKEPQAEASSDHAAEFNAVIKSSDDQLPFPVNSDGRLGEYALDSRHRLAGLQPLASPITNILYDASPKPDSAMGGLRALQQESGGAIIMKPTHKVHINSSESVVKNTSRKGTANEWPPSQHQRPTVRGDWQPVAGARDKFYVYSAFLDVRQGRFVRIVATTRTRNSEKVSCIYWYDDPRMTPVTVSASNKVIRENWNLKYSAIFVLCPLYQYSVGKSVPIPDEVSVIVSPNHRLGNRLRILNRNFSMAFVASRSSSSALPVPAPVFAVCVKPLHYNFNRVLQLIEFIEWNRILGVQHFTFYNHTIGPDVDCVLRSYIEQGLVTLLPWQLDMVSQKEIRTEGLFAAINDCLYRNMYHFRYLLMIDIDEFIIPHRNLTLGSMMLEFDKKVDPGRASSFSFMNSFFYLQWPNDANSRDLLLPLVTLQKTKRRAKFHPHKQRSKCIIVAKNVVEMGNHFVWEFLPGKGAVNVPPEIAFLHHYRVCEFGGNDCVKTQSVTDRTVYRYKTELVQRVMTRIERTQKTEQCQTWNVTVT